jgi:hypothetical protein
MSNAEMLARVNSQSLHLVSHAQPNYRLLYMTESRHFPPVKAGFRLILSYDVDKFTNSTVITYTRFPSPSQKNPAVMEEPSTYLKEKNTISPQEFFEFKNLDTVRRQNNSSWQQINWPRRDIGRVQVILHNVSTRQRWLSGSGRFKPDRTEWLEGRVNVWSSLV